jgi:hypothetical protein
MAKPVQPGISHFDPSNPVKSTRGIFCEYKNCLKKVAVVWGDKPTCKCEKYFCTTHFEYPNHACTFDWTAYRRQMSNSNANAYMAVQARKFNIEQQGDSDY